MKKKYRKAENHPIMVEIRKIKEELSREIDADPIAFENRIRGNIERFFKENGRDISNIEILE